MADDGLGPGRPAPDYRARLVRFYECYNQSCIPSVDSILATYGGREEELLRVLVNKYGPEPEDDRAAAREADHTLSAQRHPHPHSERRASSPPFLPPHLRSRQQSGRTSPAHHQHPRDAEDEIGRASAVHDRVVRMLIRYGTGDRSMQPADVLALPPAEARSMLNGLIAKHGPEPPATPDGVVDWRAILGAFIQQRCPAEYAKLDSLLSTFTGRERDVLAALHRRYPTVTTPSSPPASASTPVGGWTGSFRGGSDASVALATGARSLVSNGTLTASDREELRGRLQRFYRHHNTEKLSSIDRILEAFRGRPADLMAQLVSKYGPEPTDDAHPTTRSASESTIPTFPTPPLQPRRPPASVPATLHSQEDRPADRAGTEELHVSADAYNAELSAIADADPPSSVESPASSPPRPRLLQGGVQPPSSATVISRPLPRPATAAPAAVSTAPLATASGRSGSAATQSSLAPTAPPQASAAASSPPRLSKKQPPPPLLLPPPRESWSGPRASTISTRTTGRTSCSHSARSWTRTVAARRSGSAC
jgi:hypothetical protein